MLLSPAYGVGPGRMSGWESCASEQVQWKGAPDTWSGQDLQPNILSINYQNQISSANKDVNWEGAGEEQKKGKKSELTGTVAILSYWDLPSRVLLHVCKFPLSCLLLHLEPRCKRRDLTAALCHTHPPSASCCGHNRLHNTPSLSPIYQSNCAYNPLWTVD